MTHERWTRFAGALAAGAVASDVLMALLSIVTGLPLLTTPVLLWSILCLSVWLWLDRRG